MTLGVLGSFSAQALVVKDIPPEVASSQVADNTEILYPAMVHALKQKALNVKTILIPLPKGIDSTPVVSLYVQSAFSKQLETLGYYPIPVSISNALLKNNGIHFGEDVDHIPTKTLAQKFGADAVLYLTLEKATPDNSLLFGNQLVFSWQARLVSAQGFELVKANNSLKVQITAAALAQNGYLEALVAIFSAVSNAVKTDDEAQLLGSLLDKHKVVYNFFSLPTEAIYALQPGPYGIQNVSRAVPGKKLEIEKGQIVDTEFKGQIYIAPHLYLYLDRTAAGQQYKNLNTADPKFYGLVEFPAEVTNQSTAFIEQVLKAGSKK
ncbi:GNA1162 family protein [Psittacicella hinzii]